VALPQLSELNSQDLAITVWAFACARCIASDRIATLCDRVIDVFSMFEQIALLQLYQFWVFVCFDHPHLCRLDPHQQKRLREAYTQTMSRPSQLQHDVSNALSRLGWSHDFEHVTEEGFSLDMAQPETKHGIEVDGPSHYLRDTENGSFVENGATQLKTRLLGQFGWTITHVPFFEWDHLESEAEKRNSLPRG